MTRADAVASDRLAAARERFAPIFASIAERAPEHERAGTRPYDEVRELAAAGFGALRVPVEFGGSGLGIDEFFAILVDLGAADSNQPQLWRNHIAFVEDRIAGAALAATAADNGAASTDGADRDRRWLERIGAGAVIGGAWSETGSAGILGDTRIERVDGTFRVNGVKYYSTGSIFADHVGVLAIGESGEPVIALVPRDAEGLELVDDWSGFGQRATGSGTTRLRDVAVADEDVIPFEQRFVGQEAVYQLVLVSALAGIARAVRDDTVAAVTSRARTYPHANAPVARDDVQLKQVVGRIAAYAASAEASAERAARVLVAAVAAPDDKEPSRRAAVAVYEAQIVAADAALEASTLLFDALGSSGVQRSAQLDRHWRNARTVVSHNPRVYKERVLGDHYLNGFDALNIYAVPEPDAEGGAEG
ncbi:hypothetical protein ET445_05075 [Agromyces protaetiae]|uniref:Acyl-CoA dehydrogenase n=1 Tax=Agromyces protaetiae TaxID=2509455 RepID=A0A4P6FQK1_9MICO|nr:acyl-CoA dehydrogenase family protein [Agromyces protaetiae]QAY72808.1 hypothetical protein ET445_05075 [Agromyces protaetiae]